MNQPLLTVTQAAAATGIKYHTILRQIRLGKIPSEKLGNNYLVKQSDVESNTPNAPGRPKK